MKLNSSMLLLLAALMMVLSCARNPVTGKRQLSLMSTKQEIALGVQSDPQVLQEFGLYEDEKLQKYIEEKGQAMAKVSHRPDLPWTFRLVDSEVVNAFALPGGFVYFTRGIMAHFNNEAQFAGVLGHEIGHVTARHGAEQYTKGTLAQIGLIAGMIASPEFAQFSDLASQGVQLLLLKNGRDDETQSDELGVSYSSKIGYDAVEMADFFTTLKRITDEATGGQQIPTFLSTHPNPLNRYEKVKQKAMQYQRGKPNNEYKVNREEYLRMIDGIIYGADPKQGFVENNVFYHPVLKFQFDVPNGWQTHNAPTQFQMVSRDQKAMVLLTLSQQKNMQAAVQEVVQKFGFKVVEDRQTKVNGLDAYVMLSDQYQQGQTQPNGQQAPAQKTGIRVLSTFIAYGGNIYVLHGVTQETMYNGFSNSLRIPMQSFKELTDQEKITRKPERVKVQQVAGTKTFKQAMTDFGMPSSRIEELAILNGMQQEDQVDNGMLLKTVVQE